MSARQRRRHRVIDRAGRLNTTLQRLLDAAVATPARLRPHAPPRPGALAPGEVVHLGWVDDRVDDAQPADLYLIGDLWWGEYTGDDITRSNHRSLRREFPNEFIETVDALGAAGLALPPDCRNSTLVSALLRLRNDPVYDEEDHSALIQELSSEAWESWLSFDVPAMLRTSHGVNVDHVDDDTLRELFFRIHSERFGDEYAENAVTVVFPSLAATVAAIAAALRHRR